MQGSLRQVGTVEILRDRFYPDEDVMVATGVYPVMEDGEGQKYFSLSGYPAIPACTPERIGEGLFLIDPCDRVKSTTPVEFVRKIQGDWGEFMASDICLPGEARRFRIEIWNPPC